MSKSTGLDGALLCIWLSIGYTSLFLIHGFCLTNFLVSSSFGTISLHSFNGLILSDLAYKDVNFL